MVLLARYLLVSLYTVFWGTIALVLVPFDRGLFGREPGAITCWIGRQWIHWIVVTCGVKIVATGLENLDPDKPAVYMNNHQSLFDICALVETLPVNYRFVAKRELAWIPFFGWALAMTVGVMIDRSNRTASIASLRAAAQQIRDGANVIIFPEGTRGSGEELAPFKSGGFHLAIEAQVPVVPVTISGSQHVMPRDSFRAEPGAIKIHYGVPVPTVGLVAADRAALSDRVRTVIGEGFDPAYQGRGMQRAESGPSLEAPSTIR
ncbi:MAG: lysophospholipid acyltransferase family protein [Myxococcota bacterium]|nr:lysophospholipid acyltransferase family protein [Myxococcota bacterium]